ncbi:MAG TPA: CcoQ/FixQ family Cbb3-type cytochrome c oxidase assembly chaperone [Gammaproteobacteria bacterium]|nr:CcoQ/FixQ family Cbb3-type cytochrome c oxidase assembly chaperone [Gammaproteobacteria bacterium]
MDMVIFRSAYTVAMLLIFLGVVAWAYNRKRAARFDEAAQLPFADEEAHHRSQQSVQGANQPGTQRGSEQC